MESKIASVIEFFGSPIIFWDIIPEFPEWNALGQIVTHRLRSENDFPENRIENRTLHADCRQISLPSDFIGISAGNHARRLYVAVRCGPAGVKPTETIAFRAAAYWRKSANRYSVDEVDE